MDQSPPVLWRIARAADASLDGEGARLHGARWSSQGVAVVYAASHLPLAALEYLVHIDPEDAPDDLVALGLQVPDDTIASVCEPADLPAGWRATPPPPERRDIGDRWIREGEHLLLRVPSVLVPEESNVLINPAHPDAQRVRVAVTRQFSFDPRLASGHGQGTGFAHRPR
ncbi:MAG: RES family NAD+ phosphorylase [Gemmatimonadetes bacterium]|nr:RES family NAD+ phosphorylase [Gemmatimonadota bacterium]